MMDHSQEVHDLLGPLSLLSRLDINSDWMMDRFKDVRSESSAHKKVKSIPTSLTQLCKQLEERITQKSQHYSVCHEDRQSLTAVLNSELGRIWQNLKTASVDTTLTQEERVKLHCQTFSEVLHICEQLFLQYLQLTKTLQMRGVFSDCVNRRRLAAQLAMDCTRLLNVRSIRCRIVTGIKAARKTRTSAVTQQMGLQTCCHSMESSMMGTPGEKAVEDDLKEILDKIGELDLQHVYDLLPCHMEPICYKTDTQCTARYADIFRGSTSSMASKPTQEQDQRPSQNQLFRMKGCHSMPDLQRETLLEELEITLPNRPPSPLVLLSTDLPSNLEKHISPGEDLRRLLQESDYKDDSNCETDLCPLIEAMICYKSSRLQRLKQRLQKIMEEEVETRKHKDLMKKPSHTQGDVVTVAVSPNTIVRTAAAAARVSDKVLPETIKLNPPVFNDLSKEIDSATVTQLDRNLAGENMEISKVFEELSKRISTKYFSFDEDPRIEPALTDATRLSKHVIDDKLINPFLRKPNPYSISHRERTERAANRNRPVDATSRAYRAWFQWWRCQLSMDDYLNYISNQDSDYLSVLFHLYDSDDDDDDDEDDEEAERQKLAQLQRDEKRRMQLERISSLRRRKHEFVSGFWNINTIKMGGLGREPELEESNPEEEIQDAEGEGPAAGLLDGEQLQVRLETVWNALRLPEGQRLDMAIKYSSNEYRDHLQEAIAAWEQAARLIQKRELLLSRLEDFEREASDPNRFFQRGYHGSSITRMEEASQRENLHSQISVVDQELSKTIGHITARFNDNISYEGRPYREKMRWDRTEMLYWLQQERRIRSLEMFVEGRMALPVRLPPLSQSEELHLENHQTLHKHRRLLQHCEL